MEHILADQGLRVTCLTDPHRIDELDQDRIFADLSDGSVAGSLLPWHSRPRLHDQDFLVLVSSHRDNRYLGLLAASERATEREPFLLLESAYVTPGARGRNLFQRMIAFAVLCIARHDTVPTVIAACAHGEACRHSLQELHRHFTAASVFPRPNTTVIDFGMAGLAQRVARVIRPGAVYEAGSGLFRTAGANAAIGAPWNRLPRPAEQTLVLVDLGARDDATIVKEARRLYRSRPNRTAIRNDFAHGVAGDAVFVARSSRGG